MKSPTRTLVSALLTAGVAALAVPLPNAVFYGTVMRDGEQLTAADAAQVTAWIDDARVARYTLGDTPETGDSYVLTIPLATSDDPAGAHIGDVVHFTVDGEATGVSIAIVEHGTMRNVPLSVGQGTVRAPVPAPAPGLYADTDPIDVTLTCATPNTVIYYTLDGADPAPDGGATEYADPITLNADAELRCRAFYETDLLEPSPTVVATYLFRAEDGDGDGMLDAWEQQIVAFDAFDAMRSAADVLPGDDFDRDGLTNLEEFNAGTDPTSPDTDGDGLPDAWEVQKGLDPLVADADGDPDGDGVTNADELRWGGDPHGRNVALTLGRGWNLIGAAEDCQYPTSRVVNGIIWSYGSNHFFRVSRPNPEIDWHEAGILKRNHGYWIYSVEGGLLVLRPVSPVRD